MSAEDELSLRAHRIWIGVLGFSLPFVLPAVDALRPTPLLTPWRLLGAISEYYYTGASGVFAGVLVALGLFLITYRGYKDTRIDRGVGLAGGCAALVVAWFPCAPPSKELRLHWWSCGIGKLHYVAASALFFALMVFSIFLFTKSSIPQWRRRPREKKRRDIFSVGCGVVIGLSMLAALLIHPGPIFVPESTAIVAFASSWLVKACGSARGSRRADLRSSKNHG